MKVVKKDLVEGLKMVKGFCSKKSFPELGKVLIDGPGQRIVATDLQSRAVRYVKLTDYQQKVTGEKSDVVYPDEDFTADLKSLKMAQLADLCEYAGIDAGEKPKKADMVEKIFSASESSAQAEEKLLAPETEVDECFLVDPDHLLRIVNSENAGDVIDLHIEDFVHQSGFTATVLAVGEHFQRIPLGDANGFPDDQQHEWTKSGVFTGDIFRSLTDVCPGKLDALPYHKVVMFDQTNNLVSCDGNRLHIVKHVFTAPKDLTISAECLKTLSRITGDKEIIMSVDKTGEWVQFQYEKMTVTTRDEDTAYPDYSVVIDVLAGHEVEIENKEIKSLMNQVGLIAGSAEFVFNGGLNVEAVDADKGEYRRIDIPFLKGKVDPEMTIRLNTEYVSQALKHLGDKVIIKMTDSDQPVFFESGDNFKAVIMGMRC